MQLVLTDALRRAEQLFGRREAVVCAEVRMTYAQLGERCRRLASALRRLQVGQGDRVAVLMRNCHRYLELYLAVPAVAGVIVPLNTRHALAEHGATLADCGARLLIVDEAHEQLAGQLAGEVDAVLLCPADYERLLASSAVADLSQDPDEEALAALFYTGGTTGAPKGVMLTHRNLVANAFHITIGLGYGETDTFLHAAPMFHVADAGSIHALIWRGARHIIVPSFEPGAVLDLMQREGVTRTIMVPTMLGAVVQHPRLSMTDLTSLQVVAHGGAPISSQLVRRAVAALGCSFLQAYGLTEASSYAASLRHEERLLDHPRLRSVGQAAMGTDVAVRRPDGSRCEVGEVGEVTLRGPHITSGYWGRRDETSQALRGGWFWTGDLGYLDDEGYLYLVDRSKDMIISGGENVYSAEVEAALCAHPSILEAAVIGVPDERWGERVHAVLVLNAGHDLDALDLRAFCAQRIAGYKWPRSLEVVDRLPKSALGKVLKHELRAHHRSSVEQPTC